MLLMAPMARFGAKGHGSWEARSETGSVTAEAARAQTQMEITNIPRQLESFIWQKPYYFLCSGKLFVCFTYDLSPTLCDVQSVYLQNMTYQWSHCSYCALRKILKSVKNLLVWNKWGFYVCSFKRSVWRVKSKFRPCTKHAPKWELNKEKRQGTFIWSRSISSISVLLNVVTGSIIFISAVLLVMHEMVVGILWEHSPKLKSKHEIASPSLATLQWDLSRLLLDGLSGVYRDSTVPN